MFSVSLWYYRRQVSVFATETQRSRAVTKGRPESFGLAAGCEAMALPRSKLAPSIGLCPWFGAAPRLLSQHSRRDVFLVTRNVSSGAKRTSSTLEFRKDLPREGAQPEPGAEPKSTDQRCGEAEPSPHIQRQSRHQLCKTLSVKQAL
jgi:hypothetical protein